MRIIRIGSLWPDSDGRRAGSIGRSRRWPPVRRGAALAGFRIINYNPKAFGP
jgi:hypothetical protein